MDHSLIRLPLSENFSAQYTQLTHFTHTPAQTQHRNHSFQHPLIYTEFLRYNYNFNAFHKTHINAHGGADKEVVYKAILLSGLDSWVQPAYAKPVNNLLDHKTFLLKK